MDTLYTLTVQNLTVARRGKVILNRASFEARPGELLAIIGPNGAGKSTLMKALAGQRPEEGEVRINGEDIYGNPELWLQRIGYVPVDDVLHDGLLLEEALRFLARLRLPESSAAERDARVEDLLCSFGFPAGDPRRKKPLKVLSSGEKKRANVCAELLTNPPILLLDEPTSNLDCDAESGLMRMLAEYAHAHRKTVIVITHTLSTLDLCDQVLYVENSRLRKAGQPGQAQQELLTELGAPLRTGGDGNDFYAWAYIFEKTPTRPEARANYTARPAPRHKSAAPAPQPAWRGWKAQFACLFVRYTRVRWNDPLGLLLVLLAGFSGVLFFTLPGSAFIKPFDAAERALALNQARQSVYVIALVTSLLGMITSYTEVSKEWRIFAHERLKGLSTSAYYLSKWAWLALAVGVLAPVVLLLFIVLVYSQALPGFPSPRIGESFSALEILLRFQLPGLFFSQASWLVLFTLVLCCITSISLGLLISCAAGGSGRGYLYLSFAVVFIVLFSGLLRNPRLEQLIEGFSYFSTGKWAYEGLSSSLDLYCWMDSWRFDEFNSPGHLFSVWLALGAFSLAAGMISIALLRLRDPWRSAWASLGVLFTRRLPAVAVCAALLALLLSYSIFLRDLSYQYHALNYWNRAEYGGANAYQYGDIRRSSQAGALEKAAGLFSQSGCTLP